MEDDQYGVCVGGVIVKIGTLLKPKYEYDCNFFTTIEMAKKWICDLSYEEDDYYRDVKLTDIFIFIEKVIEERNSREWLMCYSLKEKMFVTFLLREVEEIIL